MEAATPFSAASGASGVSSPAAHTIPVAQGGSPWHFVGPLTNGQLLIGSTGNDPVPASLTGTANQIVVTQGNGSITLSLPQDIDVAAAPFFKQINVSSSAGFCAGYFTDTAHTTQAQVYAGNAEVVLGSVTNTQVNYKVNNATVLSTTTAGQLGVGTSTPNSAVLVDMVKATSGALGPVLRLTGGGGSGAACAIDLATYDPGANSPAFRVLAVDDNNFGANVEFQLKLSGSISNSLISRLFLNTNGNLGLGGQSFGNGSQVFFVADTASAPSTNPTGGGLIYVLNGALKYRGSSGTVTTLANA